MTLETDIQAFLAEPESATGAAADARATALDLVLPEACRAGVIDNLDLLRRQAGLFVAAAPDGPVAAFQP